MYTGIILLNFLQFILVINAYFVGPNPMNWTDANQYCINQGSSLAEIQDEIQFAYAVAASDNETECWIGLRDFKLTNEGQVQLINNTDDTLFGFYSNGSMQKELWTPLDDQALNDPGCVIMERWDDYYSYTLEECSLETAHPLCNGELESYPSEITQSDGLYVTAVIFTVLTALIICIVIVLSSSYFCIKLSNRKSSIMVSKIACCGYVCSSWCLITIPLIICIIIVWAIYNQQLTFQFVVFDKEDNENYFKFNDESILFWIMCIVPIIISIIIFIFCAWNYYAATRDAVIVSRQKVILEKMTKMAENLKSNHNENKSQEHINEVNEIIDEMNASLMFDVDLTIQNELNLNQISKANKLDLEKFKIDDKARDEMVQNQQAFERDEPFGIGPLNEENREEMLRIQRNMSFGLK